MAKNPFSTVINRKADVFVPLMSTCKMMTEDWFDYLDSTKNQEPLQLEQRLRRILKLLFASPRRCFWELGVGWGNAV